MRPLIGLAAACFAIAAALSILSILERNFPVVHRDGGIREAAILHQCKMCVNCCDKCNSTNDMCCCLSSPHCTCPPKNPTRDSASESK